MAEHSRSDHEEPRKQQNVQQEDHNPDHLQPVELIRQVVEEDRGDPCTHVDGEPGGSEVEDPATPFAGDGGGG